MWLAEMGRVVVMVEGIIMNVSRTVRGVDVEVVKSKLGGVNETESAG